VQNDGGAPRGQVHRFHGEFAVGPRLPSHAFRGRQSGAAAQHFDPIGHDECGVETHAELADERGVLLLVAGELLEELGGSGARDGAEMRDGIFAAHADAVVADGQSALVLVRFDPYRELGVAGHQFGPAQGFEPQLVVGVGSIRNQLAQEDLAVAVQRMDHELQQLTDFGLETQGLLGIGFWVVHGAARLRAPLVKFKPPAWGARRSVSVCGPSSRTTSPCS
jgi:hypothetical protein